MPNSPRNPYVNQAPRRSEAPARKSSSLRALLAFLLVLGAVFYLGNVLRGLSQARMAEAASHGVVEIEPTALPEATTLPSPTPSPTQTPTALPSATLSPTHEPTATAVEEKVTATPLAEENTPEANQGPPLIQITPIAGAEAAPAVVPERPPDANLSFPSPAPEEKVIYLSFDDGPDPRWTPEVLKLLAEYDAKATFFVLGRNAVSYPELIAQVAAEGHAIGNHGYNHAKLSAFGQQGFDLEVLDTQKAIESALADQPERMGQVCKSLRPPYGELDAGIRVGARRLGYELAFWGIDTMDWASPAPRTILKSVVDALEPQRVILMHDGGGNRQVSVEALGLLLEDLSERGYSFKALCGAGGQAIIWP